MRMSSLGSTAHLWLGLAFTSVGCAYDLDKLYEHGVVDAGMESSPDSGGPPPVSSPQLIQSWIGSNPLVDQECVTCAEQNCADVDTACRADPECLAYTQCVGAAPNPAGQAACRVAHSAWIREPATVRDRDLTGPYGQCVFRYKCKVQCAANSDLSCVQHFSWPTSPGKVPLHLFVVDAQTQTEVEPDVLVRVCEANDRNCEVPVSQGTTDKNGLVELELTTTYVGAFTGYLEVTGNKRYPTLLKFSWNIGQETTYLVGIVNQTQFKLALSDPNLKVDDKRGMLQLRMLGCGGLGTQGVTFAASTQDAASMTWYIDGIVPKFGALATNDVGSGGIINVPEGLSDVTAFRATDMAPVAKATVPVRANWMSVVVFEPLAAGQ